MQKVADALESTQDAPAGAAPPRTPPTPCLASHAATLRAARPFQATDSAYETLRAARAHHDHPEHPETAPVAPSRAYAPSAASAPALARLDDIVYGAGPLGRLLRAVEAMPPYQGELNAYRRGEEPTTDDLATLAAWASLHGVSHERLVVTIWNARPETMARGLCLYAIGILAALPLPATPEPETPATTRVLPIPVRAEIERGARAALAGEMRIGRPGHEVERALGVAREAAQTSEWACDLINKATETAEHFQRLMEDAIEWGDREAALAAERLAEIQRQDNRLETIEGRVGALIGRARAEGASEAMIEELRRVMALATGEAHS